MIRKVKMYQIWSNKSKKYQTVMKTKRKHATNVIVREDKSLRSYTGHTKAEQITFLIPFNKRLIKIY